MKNNILPSTILTLCCIVLFCGIYTAVILGIAQFAPNHGKGEIIVDNGKTYYSNLGQKFTDDKYFWSRPSAVDYNAAGSGGSNKGPTNPDYLAQVQARIDIFLVHNPSVKNSDIPSELVTASGSGQDPNLSPAGAMVQVPRIAKTRNISEGKLIALVNKHSEKPLLGLFGTTRVNVLKLNIDLNNLK